MVSPSSGKVLSYSVRSKACRVCSISESTNKDYEWSKNWKGSLKAMEAAIVVEMVKESHKSKGITVSRIIGYEDTTTIARLKNTHQY